MTSVSFRTSVASGTDGTFSTATFTAIDIGTAVGGRLVVFGIAGRDAAGTVASFTSVVADGVTMTPVQTFFSGGSFSGLFILSIPTGTTANITVTWNKSVSRYVAATWALYDIQSPTPRATNSSSSASPTLSVNTLANGVAIGIGYSTASTWTISGVTQNFSQSTDGSSGTGCVGGSILSAAGGTPLAITASYSFGFGSNSASVSASFDPMPSFDWFQNFSVPARRKPSAARQQFAFFSPFTPPAIVAFDWFTPLSEPVRRKPGIHASRQMAFAIDPTPKVSFSWFEPLSEPKRFKRGPHPSRQLFSVLHANPVVSFGWFEALSEPKRFKRGLHASRQQFLAAPSRLLPNPNVSGVLNATETKDSFLAGTSIFNRPVDGEIGVQELDNTGELSVSEAPAPITARMSIGILRS